MYKRQSISKDQIEKLKQIGLTKSMDKWMIKLNMLEEYHKKNGDFKIKQSDKEYSGLYYWLYKIHKKGTSLERKEQLSSLGYPVDEIKEIDNE